VLKRFQKIQKEEIYKKEGNQSSQLLKMSKLICLSLILLVIFAVAFCEESPKQVLVAKKESYNDDYQPELKNSDFRPEENHGSKYRPQESHGKSKTSYRPQETHEESKYRPQESHEKSKPLYRPQEVHEESKSLYRPQEESKYGNEADQVDETKLLKGPKYFRFCTYTTPDCQFTGVPSCILIENGKCMVLPLGDSIIAYAIGDSVTALYSFFSTTCNSPFPLLLPQEFGSCFKPSFTPIVRSERDGVTERIPAESFLPTGPHLNYKFLSMENIHSA